MDIKQDLLKAVKNHKMKVISECGDNRVLLFKEPIHHHAWFHLVTFNDSLCILGDYGSFTFRRIHDMFTFFRNDKLKINPYYWAEKVQAEDRSSGGVDEFSKDIFRKNVKEDFEQFFYDHPEKESYKDDCWKEIKEYVYYHTEDEREAIQAACNFEHKKSGFNMYDFWDHSCRDYTYRFIWCCYAIVWGIQQYDKFKERNNINYLLGVRS